MIPDHPTTVADVGFVVVWLGAATNYLPAVAAFFSILWFGVRILESQTVQLMFGKYAWIKKETRHGDD